MIPWWFLYRIHPKQVAAAIAEAEQRTSGEIRVFISHRKVADPMTAAKAEFEKLGMTQTDLRNGVLFYIAPRSRNFAILGDSAIDEKCGEGFWKDIAAKMAAQFHEGHLCAGLIEGICTAGHLLQEHFPRSPDDRNELPDRILGGF